MKSTHLDHAIYCLVSVFMLVTIVSYETIKVRAQEHTDTIKSDKPPIITNEIRIAALLKSNELANANAAFFTSLSDAQKQAWQHLNKVQQEYQAQTDSISHICGTTFKMSWDDKQGPFCESLTKPTPAPIQH
jgi:rubrerythrin